MAVHASTTCLSPGVAVRPAGAGGGVAPAGVALVSFEAALVTPPTTAATLKKYVVPFVSPVFVKVGLVKPLAIAVGDSPFAAVPRKTL